MKKQLALCVALAGCILWVTSCGIQKSGDRGSQTQVREISLPTGTTDADTEPEPTATPENNKSTSHKRVYPRIVSKAKVEDYGGTVKVGDSAYELYNYVDSYAKSYAKIINKVASSLKNSARVYDMVVPTSVGVTFPDNKVSRINSTPQKKAVKSIYNNLSSRVTGVDVYDALMRHRKEYIFFRTDHHWTGKGAYYAYQAFCEASGQTAHELTEYQKINFGTFLGTFYSDTGNSKGLRKDYVKAFYPINNDQITMTYWDENGGKYKNNVISDATGYGTSMKYLAFISGDNPYAIIRNHNFNDGSRCIVVKESYGNAFVPYLADHYQTVYVVDYRYWEGSIAKLAKQKKVKDVIFINNISMTRNAYLIGKMAQVE